MQFASRKQNIFFLELLLLTVFGLHQGGIVTSITFQVIYSLDVTLGTHFQELSRASVMMTLV